MIQDFQQLTTPEFKRKLTQCIHCGMCLQACPTYKLFGTEMDSPRGRIALMRAGSLGAIKSPDAFNTFTQHIDLCLGCRACESACPSGVQYSQLVENTRFVIEKNRAPGVVERFLRWVGTIQLMPHQRRLQRLANLLRLYQKSGLQNFIRASNLVPEPFRSMESILPPLTYARNDYAQIITGGGKPHIQFFTGCIQESFLPQVNRATMRVLQVNGFQVNTPQGQTCCGAAHLHLGDIETARDLARQNIDAFLDGRDHYSAVINNAGGCGAALKEYPHLLADDHLYKEKARRFSAMVYDINEFLYEHLNQYPMGEINKRATYCDSCHLRHSQKIIDQPRQLLKQVPGLDFREIASPDQCCGSAGVYNITHVKTASQILEAKMLDIKNTGAQLVVTSNTGCYMQLISGVRKSGLDAQVLHVVEVLEKSYEKQGLLKEG